MRELTREDIIRAVSGFVQPLSQGMFDSVEGAKAKLKMISENKTADHYLHAMPFGLVSNPAPVVKAFVLNLLGQVMAPIIVAHFDQNRPTQAQGGTTLYSTTADGTTIKVTIALNPDGTLVITAPTKVQVVCDDIELGEGALQKILNGEVFQTRYNGHTHIVLGIPTSAPVIPSPAGDLSSTVKAGT